MESNDFIYTLRILENNLTNVQERKFEATYF